MHRWLVHRHGDGDLGPVLAADVDPADVFALGQRVPVHLDGQRLRVLHLARSRRDLQPRRLRARGEADLLPTAVEHDHVARGRGDRVEHRQARAGQRHRPAPRIALDGHAGHALLGHIDRGQRRQDVALGGLPVGIADARLRHHARPLAAGDLVLVDALQLGVAREQLTRLVGPGIGRGAALRGVEAVAAHRHVQVVEVGAGQHRILDQLVPGIAVAGGDLRAEQQGAPDQRVPAGEHALGLALVDQAPGVGRDQLGFAARVVLGVAGEYFADVLRVLRPELLGRPGRRIAFDPCQVGRVRVPGLVEEGADRQFHRLDVADIDDPQPLHAVRPRQPHLFPAALDLGGVEPLVVARAADVVEVVVHAVAAGAPAGRVGQAADVAPVVVGEQQGDVIGHAHAGVMVVLHFLVQRPDLRGRLGRLAGGVGDDPALVGDDAFEQGGGGAFGHGFVAVATHAQGDYRLAALQALDPATPEPLERGSVLRVVPWTLAVAVPLVVGAHHRFVVAGADDHAVLVGHFRVARIVVVERARLPHRRPQVVGLVPQQQLEHALVELVVRSAVGGPDPAAQRRFLVVDEDAPVPDLRCVHETAGRDVQGGAHGRGHVGPPGPRRDADPARQFVQAERRAPPVGTDHQQGTVDARFGIVDHL